MRTGLLSAILLISSILVFFVPWGANGDAAQYPAVFTTGLIPDEGIGGMGSFFLGDHFSVWHMLIAGLVVWAFMFYREKKIKNRKQQLQRMIESRARENEFQQEELKTQIEFTTIQNHKIQKQNKELEKHRQNLEYLVKKRTHDLEKAKMHAEESDRLKSAFLANMSHEIRTPMNAIVGFTNIMMEEHLNEEEQQELLEHIHDSSNYLLKLIENIIDISKMESGELGYKYRPSDIDEIIDTVHQNFITHKELVRKNLNFKIERNDHDGFMLETDAYRVKQVLSNLVDNAIKFTYKGEVVIGYHFTTLDNTDAVEFFVRDTGIGMSQQQQKHIFDLFRKTNSGSNTRLYGGTGIGLSICRKLTIGLQGEIHVSSRSGAGSRFSVIIPNHPAYSEVESEGAENIPGYQNNPR
jgi:signal transduction histidine kinase